VAPAVAPGRELSDDESDEPQDRALANFNYMVEVAPTAAAQAFWPPKRRPVSKSWR